MIDNQANTIDKMFEYNLWANTRLIKLCSELRDEQMAIKVDGAYGQIRPTIVHILQAEGGYLRHLTGSRPWAEGLNWDEMSMSTLLEMAQTSGKQLIAIASKTDASIKHEIVRDGQPYHFFNWTVLLQALYHGIEHRTQIKILLTQLGVAHPELAAWDYTESVI